MNEVRDREPTLICQDCTLKLKEAIDLRSLCLESSKYFNQVYHPDEIVEYEEIEYITDVKSEHKVHVEEEHELVQEQYEVELLEEKLEEKLDQDDYIEEEVYYDHKQDVTENEEYIEYQEVNEEGTRQELEGHDEAKSKRKRCQICFKLISNEWELIKHIQTVHEGRRDHVCKICGFAFGARTNLLRHYKRKHPNVPFEDSTVVYNVQESLINSNQITKIENYVGFEFLEQEFNNQKILKEDFDDDEEALICDICNKTFDTRPLFDFHFQSEHAKGKKSSSKCPICFKTISNIYDLKKHIKITHEKVREFVCPVCGWAFGVSSNLNRHMKNKHPEEARELADSKTAIQTMTDEHSYRIMDVFDYDEGTVKRTNFKRVKLDLTLGPLICDLCGQSCKTRRTLESHFKAIHLKTNLQQCELCMKILSSRSELKRHIEQVHEQRRDFQCTECGMRFGKKGNLTRHIRVQHENLMDIDQYTYDPENPEQIVVKTIKALSCHMCGKKFYHQFQLRHHISVIHLKEERQQCDACGVWINCNRDMKKHIENLHGTKTKDHVCADCGKAFWNTTFLMRVS